MGAQFSFDHAQEQLLQPYLDRCYRVNGIQADRCKDWKQQMQGVDIILSKDGFSYEVDEKAQLHYIGQHLPTFALEIDILLNGKVRPGWLFDESKATGVYAFVFDIEHQRGGTVLHRSQDVLSAQIVLVNRQRLHNVLAAEGLDRSSLEQLAKELREKTSDSRSVRRPGVRVVRSHLLEEQPVNLLVTRRFLESIGQVLRPTTRN